VAYHLALSCQVIAFANPAHVWSVARHSIVAWYCSGESARLAGHDYAAYPHAVQAPRYVQASLGNVWTMLFSRYSQILLYSSPTYSYGTRGGAGALPSGETGSKAVGRVAAPEPSRARRWDPKPQNTWQLRNPPEQGGGVQSHRTCGGSGALPSREVGSRAVRRVTVPEPSRMGLQGLVPLDTRQCTVARPASCLSLELSCGDC
jgi:hypothetical protein